MAFHLASELHCGRFDLLDVLGEVGLPLEECSRCCGVDSGPDALAAPLNRPTLKGNYGEETIIVVIEWSTHTLGLSRGHTILGG